MTSLYEYDIMNEKSKILYKHIPKNCVYGVVDKIKYCENEKTQFYCFTLDDHAYTEIFNDIFGDGWCF